MPDDPSTKAALQATIRTLERTRLRALVAGDMAVADSLHADDFQLIPPSGIPHSKAEYLGANAAGELAYRVFEPATEIDVRVRDAIAVIRYRSRLEIVDHGDLIPLAFSWHTDHYELRGDRWQIVWSQATTAREPHVDETP